MKKILCILLTLCLTVSIFSISVYALNTSDIKNSYDYNSDGKVNLYDARAILKVSADIEAPVEGKLYDLDGDGFVTFYDVKAVLNVAVGIDTEIDVAASQEFLLSLFVDELNRVKVEKPGFKRNTVQTTDSALITIGVLGVSESLELSEFAEKYGDESMKDQIQSIYTPVSETYTVNRRSNNHKTVFLVNTGTEEACLLTVDDIKNISCYEKDGYIYRTVTMNEQSYTAAQYPSTSNDLIKNVSYAKIFTVPRFSTGENEIKSITFKNGEITVKVDKYTGLPVSVDSSYTYSADLAWDMSVGSNVVDIDFRLETTISESYTINPMEVK